VVRGISDQSPSKDGRTGTAAADSVRLSSPPSWESPVPTPCAETYVCFGVSYLFNFFIKHSEEFLLAFGDVHAERQSKSISTDGTSSVLNTSAALQSSEGPGSKFLPLRKINHFIQ